MSASGLSHVRRSERIELLLADGTRHTARLSLPEQERTRLAAVIVLAGFETGEKSVELLRDDLDVIYATIDYPYKAPEARGLVRDLKEVPAIKKAVHRADLVLDALISKLETDPRVDMKKISIVGASFGAPFALAAAARNAVIGGVILVHAFGRVDLAIERQLANEWGSWSRPVAWLLGKAAWFYLDYREPEVTAENLNAHQRVFFIFSETDEQLPCESIASLLEGLKRSPAQVTAARSSGGHLGPGKIEMIDLLIKASLEWLKSQQLL
jgi:dienelactone hydrolase